MSFGNDDFYKNDFAFLTTTNFQPIPKYVRVENVQIQLHEAKEANVNGIEFTRRYHLPMLRQMKANLIGSSLFFSFHIDKADKPCKGVFSNGSDPLAYLSTELLPLLSSGIPKIIIDARCLNNSSAKFYEQFLVPFLSIQNVTCSNDVGIKINREVEDRQFSFAIPFDPIFKWLHFTGTNSLKKSRRFVLEISSTESNIPMATELEAFETRIISVIL